MDIVRKLILEKLVEVGLTMSEASIKIGRNHAYLQQFLKRGVPAQLGEKERAALSSVLGVPEDQLRGRSEPLPKREYHTKSPDVVDILQRTTELSGSRHIPVDNANSLLPTVVNSDHTLPVYGSVQVAGGLQRMTREAVNWASRPEPLLRVREAYGLFVTGDLMAPKLENGSTALINPHLPWKSGDACVFRSPQSDGTVLITIRELRRFTDDTWYVRQSNPQKDTTLKRSEWSECHVIIGSYFAR